MRDRAHLLSGSAAIAAVVGLALAPPAGDPPRSASRAVAGPAPALDCGRRRIILVTHFQHTDVVGGLRSAVELFAQSRWLVDGYAACAQLAAEEADLPSEPCRPRTGSPADRYYDLLFCPPFDRNDYYFEWSFPLRGRARVVSAARRWSALGRLELRAHIARPVARLALRRGAQGVGFDAGDCRRTIRGRPVSVIKWVSIDGPGHVAGMTGTCLITNEQGTPYTVRNFILAVDRDERWYMGRRPGPARDQLDLEAVATHELGHGTGWQPHLDDRLPERLCPRADAAGRLVRESVTPRVQTMCRLNAIGSSHQRTPGSRDVAIFRSGYR